MSEILITTGLAIAFGATIMLLIFAIKQWHIRQSVKVVPMRYKEWLAQYRAKRGYILIAQLIGIAISIIGCAI